MKQFLDKHPKLKNLYFWLSIVGLLFASAGIDFNTLTSWQLLGEALISILNNASPNSCQEVSVLKSMPAEANNNPTIDNQNIGFLSLGCLSKKSFIYNISFIYLLSFLTFVQLQPFFL